MGRILGVYGCMVQAVKHSLRKVVKELYTLLIEIESVING